MVLWVRKGIWCKSQKICIRVRIWTFRVVVGVYFFGWRIVLKNKEEMGMRTLEYLKSPWYLDMLFLWILLIIVITMIMQFKKDLWFWCNKFNTCNVLLTVILMNLLLFSYVTLNLIWDISNIEHYQHIRNTFTLVHFDVVK